MRIYQIEVGKTYEGRTGKPRTVRGFEQHCGQPYVHYVRDDGSQRKIRAKHFAAWVKPDAPTSAIAKEPPYRALWQDACDEATKQATMVAVLREALENIAMLEECPDAAMCNSDKLDSINEIARTALAATDPVVK